MTASSLLHRQLLRSFRPFPSLSTLPQISGTTFSGGVTDVDSSLSFSSPVTYIRIPFACFFLPGVHGNVPNCTSGLAPLASSLTTTSHLTPLFLVTTSRPLSSPPHPPLNPLASRPRFRCLIHHQYPLDFLLCRTRFDLHSRQLAKSSLSTAYTRAQRGSTPAPGSASFASVLMSLF